MIRKETEGRNVFFCAWTGTGVKSYCPDCQLHVLPQDCSPGISSLEISQTSHISGLDHLSSHFLSPFLGWPRHIDYRLITSPSTVGNCARFPSANSFCSSLGIVPAQHQRHWPWGFSLILFNYMEQCGTAFIFLFPFNFASLNCNSNSITNVYFIDGFSGLGTHWLKAAMHANRKASVFSSNGRLLAEFMLEAGNQKVNAEEQSSHCWEECIGKLR